MSALYKYLAQINTQQCLKKEKRQKIVKQCFFFWIPKTYLYNSLCYYNYEVRKKKMALAPRENKSWEHDSVSLPYKNTDRT